MVEEAQGGSRSSSDRGSSYFSIVWEGSKRYRSGVVTHTEGIVSCAANGHQVTLVREQLEEAAQYLFRGATSTTHMISITSTVKIMRESLNMKLHLTYTEIQ
jgi:hypothetical protein